MPTCNVVSWNAMIFGYLRCEQGQKALELSQQLQHGGYIVQADPVTIVRVRNTCAIVWLHLKNGDTFMRRQVKSYYELKVLANYCIIDMYAKYGSIEDTQNCTGNIITWNASL